MITLAKDLERSLIQEYLERLNDTAKIVDAFNALCGKKEITLEMIKNAFEKNGELKKPVAEFIGKSNETRITEGLKASDSRYKQLCDRDLFLLASINFDASAQVYQSTLTECGNNKIYTISDLKKSMTESDLKQL